MDRLQEQNKLQQLQPVLNIIIIELKHENYKMRKVPVQNVL